MAMSRAFFRPEKTQAWPGVRSLPLGGIPSKQMYPLSIWCFRAQGDSTPYFPVCRAQAELSEEPRASAE